MSEAAPYSTEEQEDVMTGVMDDFEAWEPLAQETLEAWDLQMADEATLPDEVAIDEITIEIEEGEL